MLNWKFNAKTFEQDFSARETVKAKYEQQHSLDIREACMLLLHFLRLTIDTSAHAPRSLRTNCTGTSWALVHSLPVPQLGQNEADPEASIHLLTCRDSDFGTWWIGTSQKPDWMEAQGAVGNSQQLYAQVRTLRQDLAGRYGTVMPITSHETCAILVEQLRNSIRWLGSSSERRWSKRYASALFGEIVLCRLRRKQPKKLVLGGSLYRLWLGRYTSTNRRIVGNTSGVFTARSIGRVPVSKQVDKELLKDFQALTFSSTCTGSSRTSALARPADGRNFSSWLVAAWLAPNLVTRHLVKSPQTCFSALVRSSVGLLIQSQGRSEASKDFCHVGRRFTSHCLCLCCVGFCQECPFQLVPMLTEKKNFNEALRKPILWCDAEFDGEQVAGTNKYTWLPSRNSTSTRRSWSLNALPSNFRMQFRQHGWREPNVTARR